jgi:hypothetical protein
VGNPTDEYSNADLPSDSEIVITYPALGEGGGGENSTPVTVDSVTVVEKAIAPSPAQQKNVEPPHINEQTPLPIYERSDGGFVTVEEAPAPAPVATPDNVASIQVDSVCHFINPDNLPDSQRFENLDLKVVRFEFAGQFAVCRLPNGEEQRFPVHGLVAKK